MSNILLDDLDAWLVNKFDDDTMISVGGGFRRSKSFADPVMPLFEIRGTHAYTVRIKIPAKAPLSLKAGSRIASDRFGESTVKWWDAWAAVLAASALATPQIDPVTLWSVLHDKRQLRLCCDTNALCNGSVAWLLQATAGKATILTSAVVDRELAAWPDRGREKFWTPTTMDWFVRRTHYRIARRLIERPASDVVVDRLSPDQSALMLSKLRDEDKEMSKSPDADMLLIELARSVVRDQPRNTRVLYITGDRNNARAAASALGANNVLFAVVDAKTMRGHHNKVLSRGWWNPNGPLGATTVPLLADLLWNALAACDFLSLASGGEVWRIKPAAHFETGTPSDWENPWVTVEEYPKRVPASSADSLPEQPKENRSIPIEDKVTEADKEGPNTITENINGEGGNRQIEEEGKELPSLHIEWLLHPFSDLDDVDASDGWRPSPKAIFDLLASVLLDLPGGADADGRNELTHEAKSILVALGAIDSQNRPGPNVEKFKDAWLSNDLDWYHHQFMRLPGYKKTWNTVRNIGASGLSSRLQVHVRMARALGQAAILDRKIKAVIAGDAPLALQGLLDALSRWLPTRNATMAIGDVCWHASQELCITPARLELAMMKLWQLHPESPFEPRTGGTVISGPEERVVLLQNDGYIFREVAMNALSFGLDGFARFITRTSDE